MFGGWELRGIGSVAPGRRIALGGGAALEVLPRSAQSTYGALLREHDVGLALMYTPHPSLVPIEMASAGLVTVTNSFENKDAAAMAEISPNLVTVEPSIPAIAAGLAGAVARADDPRPGRGEATSPGPATGIRASIDAVLAAVTGALPQPLREPVRR